MDKQTAVRSVFWRVVQSLVSSDIYIYEITEKMNVVNELYLYRIALRMRANGHSPEAVLAAIRDCAPQIRAGTEKRRNWPAYAERTMNYAFGYAGDRDLQRNARYLELWQKIELRQNSAVKTGARLR